MSKIKKNTEKSLKITENTMKNIFGKTFENL